MLIRATERAIEIYHNGQRVALHPRSHEQGRHFTIKEHMPSDHRFYSEWSPEQFIHWAEKVGPEITKVVQMELGSRQHPEQAFRACLGILGFARKYSGERLESACRYAVANEIHN